MRRRARFYGGGRGIGRRSLCAQASFQRLDEGFQPNHTIRQQLEGLRHRCEQFAGVGLAQRERAHVHLVHRAVARQEPCGVDLHLLTQCSEKLNARRLTLDVSAHSFRMRLRQVGDFAKTPLTYDSSNALVQ